MRTLTSTPYSFLKTPGATEERRADMLNAIFHFNDYYRDRFIAESARSLPAGSRVLDVGAGPCKYKPLFNHCDYKAQDFCAYEGPDLRYGSIDFVGDIQNIPVPDESFDAILCTEVFEHIPRPDLALGEFARILRHEGQLFLTAPQGSSIHMAPYHYYGGFTPHWYKHFLTEAGFRLDSCRPNGRFFRLYGQESQRFIDLLKPATLWLRVLVWPIRAMLAIWFKGLAPLVCAWLDPMDKTEAHTVGYFVKATKV